MCVKNMQEPQVKCRSISMWKWCKSRLSHGDYCSSDFTASSKLGRNSTLSLVLLIISSSLVESWLGSPRTHSIAVSHTSSIRAYLLLQCPLQPQSQDPPWPSHSPGNHEPSMETAEAAMPFRQSRMEPSMVLDVELGPTRRRQRQSWPAWRMPRSRRSVRSTSP